MSATKVAILALAAAAAVSAAAPLTDAQVRFELTLLTTFVL